MPDGQVLKMPIKIKIKKIGGGTKKAKKKAQVFKFARKPKTKKIKVKKLKVRKPKIKKPKTRKPEIKKLKVKKIRVTKKLATSRNFGTISKS